MKGEIGIIRKVISLDLKYIIICATISSYMLMPILNALTVSSARYYADYYFPL